MQLDRVRALDAVFVRLHVARSELGVGRGAGDSPAETLAGVNAASTAEASIVEPAPPDKPVATVLHTGGVQFASEKAVVERALGDQPGVTRVECNPVAPTTTVAYDPHRRRTTAGAT